MWARPEALYFKKEIKLISKIQLKLLSLKKQERIEDVPKVAFLWYAIYDVVCMC